jgi:hypothetical protein
MKLITTPEPTGIPNLPTPETEAIGRELIRLALDNEQPADMCVDCALRSGSEPNRSFTSYDVLQCLLADVPFFCHHGENRPCAGFERAKEKLEGL